MKKTHHHHTPKLLLGCTLLLTVAGCLPEIPENCNDILDDEQCANLSDVPTPTCVDIFDQEFCDQLLNQPTNVCEYVDVPGGMLFVCADGSTYTCIFNPEITQMVCGL